MFSVLVVLAAYLLGSISFAILVSRAMGLADPRTYGSGNPGATNVLRSGRKPAAVLTLAGDAGKGWLATWLAERMLAAPEAPSALPMAATDPVVALAGLLAFIGHLYPVYHGFKGGKGVATAAGVLLGYSAWLALGTLVTFVAIFAFFRFVSLASIVAALFASVYAFWLFGARGIVACVLGMALAIVWRHRENIRRLVAGTEPRFGRSARESIGSN